MRRQCRQFGEAVDQVARARLTERASSSVGEGVPAPSLPSALLLRTAEEVLLNRVSADQPWPRWTDVLLGGAGAGGPLSNLGWETMRMVRLIECLRIGADFEVPDVALPADIDRRPWAKAMVAQLREDLKPLALYLGNPELEATLMLGPGRDAGNTLSN